MKDDKNEGRKGGYLKGDSHDEPSGGIKAVVTDSNNKPVLLEGDEVIINKKSVNDPSKKTLSGTNKEILHQINTEHGGKPILAKGGNVNVNFEKTKFNNDADIEAIQKEWTSLHKQIIQKLLELNDKTQWRWFDRLTNKTPGLWDKPMAKHAKEQINLVRETRTDKNNEQMDEIKSKEDYIAWKQKQYNNEHDMMVRQTVNTYLPDQGGAVDYNKVIEVTKNILDSGIEKDKKVATEWAQQLVLSYQWLDPEWKDIKRILRVNPEEGKRMIDDFEKFGIPVPESVKENKMEEGGNTSVKSIKDCLLKDGDNENDYIVEGTKITTGEGPAQDTWEITALTTENITVKHLPKSSLGSSAGERTITYDQLREDFTKNAIQISGINSGDTRCLNLCIKAIKQTLGQESFGSGGNVNASNMSRLDFFKLIEVSNTSEISTKYKEWFDGAKKYNLESDGNGGKYLGYVVNSDNTLSLIFEKGMTTFEYDERKKNKWAPIKDQLVYFENGGSINTEITNDDIQTQIDALKILIEDANYDENGNPVDREYVNGLQDQLDALEILKNTK